MNDDTLERFVGAQAGVYPMVEAELQAGRKRTHWMWFVFPQLRGLGTSGMAHVYGIASLDEARDYLAHALLGSWLKRCTELVLQQTAVTLHEIFGSPDDMKFRSSMTLFALAVGTAENVFSEALKRYCGGRLDERTCAMLGIEPR